MWQVLVSNWNLLDIMEEKGLNLGDFKPENIMIGVNNAAGITEPRAFIIDATYLEPNTAHVAQGLKSRLSPWHFRGENEWVYGWIYHYLDSKTQGPAQEENGHEVLSQVVRLTTPATLEAYVRAYHPEIDWGKWDTVDKNIKLEIITEAAENFAPKHELGQVSIAIAAKLAGGFKAFVDLHRPEGLTDKEWAEASKPLYAGMDFIERFIEACTDVWGKTSPIDIHALGEITRSMMLKTIAKGAAAQALLANPKHGMSIADTGQLQQRIYNLLSANLVIDGRKLSIADLANMAAHAAWNMTHKASERLTVNSGLPSNSNVFSQKEIAEIDYLCFEAA